MGHEQRFEQRLRQAELERVTVFVSKFGDVTECQKCGLAISKVLAAFCVGKNVRSARRDCEVFGEHLHRRCPRCQYGWYERCKDWAPEMEARANGDASTQE